MEEQLKRYKKIEKDKEIRNRRTPFVEGIYTIRHPLVILHKPKLYIRFNKKVSKVKGEIRWFRYRIKLELIQYRDEQVVFGFVIGSFPLDLVIQFYVRDAFEGFLDTPIGHIRFTGQYKESIYME